MTTDPELDEFGAAIISSVRDSSIRAWLIHIEYADKRGQLPNDTMNAVRDLIGSWTPEQKEILSRFIAPIVDTAILSLLWKAEEGKSIRLQARLENGDLVNPMDYSDSLTGDYIDWVKAKSKYPYNPLTGEQ